MAVRAREALSGSVSMIASIASRRGRVGSMSSLWSEQEVYADAASISNASRSSRRSVDVRKFFMNGPWRVGEISSRHRFDAGC